jgi:hypothetical protein
VTAAPSLRGSVRVTLPIRTVTEGNAKENWRMQHGRATKQKRQVASILPMHIMAAGWRPGDASSLPPEGVVVTLTRISTGNGLDPHDNLPGSQKHVVDAITKQLGLTDDRDPRVTWRYDQRRVPRASLTPYGVEIRIARRVHDDELSLAG